MAVKRAFADIEEGQIHYWHGQPTQSGKPGDPLVYLHPGPGTARHQVPLLAVLAGHVRVIAPDMLGMGDSCAPRSQSEVLGLDYFADAEWRFLDSLGVSSCYLMGSSLGGRTAVEMALQQPQRVKGLILNRILMIAGEDLEEMKAKHAPKVESDQSGLFVSFVWNRMRDLITYFPWFKNDAAHMRKVDLPPAHLMHVSFIEHIKMCATSHHAFTAYWNYPIAEKLSELNVPVMCRGDTASFIKGAQTWVPAFEGDILGAAADKLQALAQPAIDYMTRSAR